MLIFLQCHKMKAIVSLFCVLALVTFAKCSPESDEEEQMKAIYMKCKNETQTEENPAEFYNKKMDVATSPKTKCMMDCVMRETGIITNGKFDKEGALKVAERYYSSKKEDMEKAKTVSNICEKRVANEPTENCNLGSKVAGCLFDESEKIGLTSPLV